MDSRCIDICLYYILDLDLEEMTMRPDNSPGPTPVPSVRTFTAKADGAVHAAVAPHATSRRRLNCYVDVATRPTCKLNSPKMR